MNDTQLSVKAEQNARRQALIVHILITLVVVSTCGVFIGVGFAFSGNPVGGTILLGALPLLLLLKPWLERAQERLRLERRRAAWYRGVIERRGLKWIGDDLESDSYEALLPLGEDQVGLFGLRSLFDRICTCETEPGRTRLAEWLARPAAADVARGRQVAVRELASDMTFRREFGVASMSLAGLGRLSALCGWLAKEQKDQPSRALLPMLVMMPLVTLAVGISYWLGWLPGLVGLSLTAIAGALHVWLGVSSGSALGSLLGDVSQLIEADLVTIIAVAKVTASAVWNGHILASLQSAILTNLVDSGAVTALRREAWLLSVANIDALWVFSTFFLLPQIAAVRLQYWKDTFGEPAMKGVSRVADLDALTALGNYAAENPDDCFPEIVDASTEDVPVFEAKQLGHPLIDPATCVRNDVAFSEESRCWVISGSNMGGKSTLLRAIGINISLAWAGGAVRANALTTSCGTVAASIGVSDALEQGQSHFSAEVTLLRKVLDLALSVPCVVLLDEILSGTNSADRRIAAREIVHRLSGCKTIGVVTTHDLAVSDDLLRLPGFLPKHFTARNTAQGLEFDYRVRDGVVEGTNGLAVLRMLGIDVDDPASAPTA